MNKITSKDKKNQTKNNPRNLEINLKKTLFIWPTFILNNFGNKNDKNCFV